MAYQLIYDDAYYGTNPSCSVMVSSESDLANLPDTLPTGTIAFTAGFSSMWQLGLDGTWTEIQ